MALYAIGDIHGCLTALKTIFQQEWIQKSDTVIFLGDYIDRGPNSKGVLDWLLENKNNYHFEFILGNHEIMMLTAKMNSEKLGEWLGFGGDNTLDSYKIESGTDWVDKIDQSHWDFLNSCKSYLEIGKYIFVHAGLEHGKELDEQSDSILFWKKFETPEMYRPDRTVVCGHTHRKNGAIADFGHTICIDTYAYGGKWLTCLNVETKEYLKATDQGQFEFNQL